MTRPAPLRLLSRHFRAARLAHEAAADLHRELVELGLDDDHTRALLHESAALALEQMPALVRPLRGPEREWAEQELLDPPASLLTAKQLESGVTKLLPALLALRARQDQIVAELLNRIRRAR